MVAAVLLLFQAAHPPQISAEVDRERVPIGDEVVYTLRATSDQPGDFRVELPNLTGLEIVDRSERVTTVTGSNPPVRELVLEVRLRAAQVGAWTFAPVLVLLGAESALAPELTITVVGAGAAERTSQSPALLSLIQRAPPPSGAVTLGVVVSAPSVIQGEQLDVLTAAWFPRSLRTRLRRPPTLKPPVLNGVWSVPQPAVPGIVASRTIGDETYDLFVSHQVVFPLTAGRMTIPPARLEYAIPTTRRASGDERPVETASDPVDVVVAPLPDKDRPAGFAGPVAKDLKVSYRLPVLPARAGAPLPVEVTVSGEGNLAFWTPPNVSWPSGTRAYLDHVTDAPRAGVARLGGTKTFHFLVVADSAGSLPFSALSYPYLDPGAGYREASAPGLVVAVLESTSDGPRRAPPALAPVVSDWPLRTAPFGRPGAGWLLAVLAPIGLGALLRASRRGLVRAPKPERSHPGVGALDQMIVALVPEDERGRAEGIVHGFRQAGVDRGTARELAGLKAQVDEARFGLEGQSHPSSLGSRAEQLLRKLPRPVRQTLGLLALVGAILVARPAGAQDGSALDLYRDGHASLAAGKFREQAEAAPEQWQLWYRLAAAEFVSGSDARAAAALERALGLAPRATLARGLWTTLEREHEPLHGAVSSSRLSVPERRALVVLLALTSGVLLGFGLGPRWVGTSTAVVAIVASLVGYSRERFAERPAGYTQSPVVLRFSPHGLAPEAGNLGALTRVVIESQVGKWVLIRDSRDIRGWVSLGAIALVRPLD